MDSMNVETVRFILDNIDKSNKRLSDLNSLIENYKFQIENVGKNSSLGQEFIRNLSYLKGEKNRLTYQIEELKQHIAGINLDDIKNNEKELKQEQEQEKEKEKDITSDNIEQQNVKEEKIKDIDIEEHEEPKDITEEKINNNSNYDYYKISCVAAFKNGKIQDAYFIDDEKEISSKVSQLYYEYGNDISIKLNYDGYVNGNNESISQNIGWIDLEKYQFSSKKNIETVDQTKEVETVEIKETSVQEDSISEEIDQDEEEYNFDPIADSYQDGRIYNFRVVYKKGKYKIDFDLVEDGDVYHQSFENKLSFKALYSKYYKQRIAEEYGIDIKSKFYRNMDLNLLLSLKEIDAEYGTDYVLDYINGSLNIKLKYDLRDMLSDKNLKPFDKLIQRKVALKQKNIAFARVYGDYYPGILVGAISSLVLITTLGISSILPSFGKKNKQDLVDNKKQVEREITTATTTEEVTVEEFVEKIVNKNNKKNNKKNTGIGINDTLCLLSKDEEGNIKYTFKLSKELNNKSNKVLASDYSDCNKFKISSIAVCKNDKELLVIDKANSDENLQTTDLYNKYGKDIDIKFNFDAYKDDEDNPRYENIGWLSLKDFKYRDSDNYVENIELAQEEIKKENLANDIVEEEAKDSANSSEENNNGFGYCNFGLDGKISLFLKDSEGNVTSSQKLSSDAWGNGKEIDVGKLDCDYFKISYMAVYSGSDVLDIREIQEEDNVDDITNCMYQKYGADIDIAFNFNGYYNGQDENDTPYEYVGWLNIKKIVNLTEKMIEQVSGNTNTITPKTYIKK